MGDKKKKRKKRRRRLLRNALIGAGGGVLAVLLFAAVFRTKQIEVTGNNRYTEGEIQKLVRQEPLSFNTVLLTFLPWRKDFSQVPFLEKISYELVSASTVRAVVEEKKAVGYVETESGNAYFDGKGIVLEIIAADTEDNGENTPAGTEEKNDDGEAAEQTGGEVLDSEAISTAKVGTEEFEPDLEEIPRVTGLDQTAPEVGKQMEVSDSEIFGELDVLARLVDRFDVWPEQVEISEEQEITLHYEGNIRVLLGDGDYLEEKITKMAKILPELDGLSGELQLQDVDETDKDIVFAKDLPEENSGETSENTGETQGTEEQQTQEDSR